MNSGGDRDESFDEVNGCLLRFGIARNAMQPDTVPPVTSSP